mmetsp:Transcript_32938/g.60604  ORF Transcript_32938/g.60604 Transcript_32938/m.60604 type:complete len:802 (-) Transcript_32938:127-2532(-)
MEHEETLLVPPARNGQLERQHDLESQYEVVRPIGSGSFGQVFLVMHRFEMRQYVMKKIALLATMDAGKREQTEMEVKLLSAMRHPNIVAYRDSFVNSEAHLCILMEYCEHGDISTYLQHAKKTGRTPDEGRLLEWFIHTTFALHALHQKRILHRDLKTQNIFLTGNRSQQVFAAKLGDFGISRMLNSTTDLAKTQIGTPFYMSPELINNKPYSYKSDVWGLGCVLYEIVNGCRPFDAQSLNGLALKIMKGHYTPIKSSCGAETKAVIKSMLSKNPSHRPTLKEILHVPHIRRRIPSAVRTVISAGGPDAKALTEDVLMDHLSALGLGSLCNGTVARMSRDRGRIQRRLEQAELRKVREEEALVRLQKTAALLQQCLSSPPELPERPRAPQFYVHGPDRSIASPDLGGDINAFHMDTNVAPASNTVGSHVANDLDSSRRDRAALSQRDRRHVQGLTAADVPDISGSRALPLRPRARTEEALMQATSDSYRPPLSERATDVSWLLNYQHISAANLENPFQNCRPAVVHSPKRGRQRDRQHRDDCQHDPEEHPQPPAYGEPARPPADAHPSGAQASMWSSWRSADPRSQPMRPHHNVCLRSLNLEQHQQDDYSDETHSNISFSDDGMSDVSAMGCANEEQQSQFVQRRIDRCKSAIRRQELTIGMLRYQEQEQAAPLTAESPSLDLTGDGAESSDSSLRVISDDGLPSQSSVVGAPIRGIIARGAATPAIVQDCVARLTRRCLEGLGSEKFQAAKNYLLDAVEVPNTMRQQMMDLLGLEKIGFYSLIDQIVHMERKWGAQDPMF